MNESALLSTCPHCGALAQIESHGQGETLSWVCAVCGAPRMPPGVGEDAAIAPLKDARRATNRKARSLAASWVFALMATFAVLVTAAAWPAALVPKLILLALAATPAAFAVRARSRAARAASAAEEAMNRAWLTVAEQAVRRAKTGMTATELARQLKLEPSRADRLLTELAVSDRTRVDLDDEEAEVRYSVPSVLAATSGGSAAHVRVGDDALVRAIDAAAADAARSNEAFDLSDGEDEGEAPSRAKEARTK